MRILLITIALVAGCGGSDDLTCEVLASPDNCWAKAAGASAACLPPGAEVGILAADRGSCTFSNGARVVFEMPLPQDTAALERLAFTIERDGATCASFVDTFMNRMELEAGGERVVSSLEGGVISLACGDGPSYEASLESLFECTPPYFPTDGFSITPGEVTFTLVSVATPGELFRCAPP